MNKFQSICWVISRTLKAKKKEGGRKKTNLKLCKVVAAPVLLYDREIRTLERRLE
jgi:hypothetical protein